MFDHYFAYNFAAYWANMTVSHTQHYIRVAALCWHFLVYQFPFKCHPTVQRQFSPSVCVCFFRVFETGPRASVRQSAGAQCSATRKEVCRKSSCVPLHRRAENNREEENSRRKACYYLTMQHCVRFENHPKWFPADGPFSTYLSLDSDSHSAETGTVFKQWKGTSYNYLPPRFLNSPMKLSYCIIIDMVVIDFL